MTTDPLDQPIYTRRDLMRIGHALLHVPHTGEIEFTEGRPPAEPTPDVLVSMLDQLAGILRGKMAAPTEVEKAVWAAWGEVDDNDPAPVKRIAAALGMTPADVAFIVYPADEFGPWDDSQEPDLEDAHFVPAAEQEDDAHEDDEPWTCDVCDEPAEVIVVQPSEDGGHPHPLCAEHVEQLGRDLKADRGD
ncbi:hypothetical protein [Nocardia thailandica]|uniref:hypothetical protein n=1 Tax=Nocardia thailandica TaxID=257275 RepID=UPI00031F4EF4|nr:hypothetical protein [Nocardia thailandica]